jgi:hypothetical protein
MSNETKIGHCRMSWQIRQRISQLGQPARESFRSWLHRFIGSFFILEVDQPGPSRISKPQGCSPLSRHGVQSSTFLYPQDGIAQPTSACFQMGRYLSRSRHINVRHLCDRSYSQTGQSRVSALRCAAYSKSRLLHANSRSSSSSGLSPIRHLGFPLLR